MSISFPIPYLTTCGSYVGREGIWDLGKAWETQVRHAQSSFQESSPMLTQHKEPQKVFS